MPGCGTHENRASLTQDAYIFLSGSVSIHPGVHGRSDYQRAGGSECGNAEQVITDTARQFCQSVGGGWGNQQQVCGMPKTNVGDMTLAAP